MDRIIIEIGGARAECSSVQTAAALIQELARRGHVPDAVSTASSPPALPAPRPGRWHLEKHDREVLEQFLASEDQTVHAAVLRKALGVTPHAFAGWMAGFRRRLAALGYDVNVIRYGAKRDGGKVTAQLRLEGTGLEELRTQLAAHPGTR